MIDFGRQREAIYRLKARGEPTECHRCGGKPGAPGCGKIIHEFLDAEYRGNLETGWQVAIVSDDESNSECEVNWESFTDDDWAKFEEEAILHAGIIPQERIQSGVWIAAIPPEWAKAAENEGSSEPGKLIQECNRYEITGPDGWKWFIEVPMP